MWIFDISTFITVQTCFSLSQLSGLIQMRILVISTSCKDSRSEPRSGIPTPNPDHEFWFSIFCKKWDMNSAISTLRAIQIKLQIQIKNSGSRFDEGIEVRIFGSHFFRKIHIRGVLTFWPWCYFLTLVSRLPAFSWPVLPLGVHRTPAAGELSPAELWWLMQAKSTFQSCSLLSTRHFNLALLLGIICPRVVKHSVCLLCFHPLRCHLFLLT